MIEVLGLPTLECLVEGGDQKCPKTLICSEVLENAQKCNRNAMVSSQKSI